MLPTLNEHSGERFSLIDLVLIAISFGIFTGLIEGAGLMLADVEILRGHYAATIKVWRERFRVHRDEIEQRYGGSFYRMWDFWFACSEVSVEHAVVYQLQLAKRHDVVPITHDYIAREEARLRGLELERSSAPAATASGVRAAAGSKLVT